MISSISEVIPVSLPKYFNGTNILSKGLFKVVRGVTTEFINYLGRCGLGYGFNLWLGVIYWDY
jgi:hypothetical protein